MKKYILKLIIYTFLINLVLFLSPVKAEISEKVFPTPKTILSSKNESTDLITFYNSATQEFYFATDNYSAISSFAQKTNLNADSQWGVNGVDIGNIRNSGNGRIYGDLNGNMIISGLVTLEELGAYTNTRSNMVVLNSAGNPLINQVFPPAFRGTYPANAFFNNSQIFFFWANLHNDNIPAYHSNNEQLMLQRFDMNGIPQDDIRYPYYPGPDEDNYCSNQGASVTFVNDRLEWPICWHWCQAQWDDTLTDYEISAPLCKFDLNSTEKCSVHQPPAGGVAACTWEHDVANPTTTFPRGGYYGMSGTDSIWGRTLITYETSFYSGLVSTQPDFVKLNASNEFYYLYNLFDSSNHIRYIQKSDVAGNMLFPGLGIQTVAPIQTVGTEHSAVYSDFLLDQANGLYYGVQGLRTDGTNNNVFLQYIDSAGNKRYPEPGLAVAEVNGQSYADWPRLVSDGANGVIILWNDYRSDPINYNTSDVYAQRVTADGQVQWETGGKRLLPGSNWYMYLVDATTDTSNNIYLMMGDYSQDDGSWNIEALTVAKFNQNGENVGPSNPFPVALFDSSTNYNAFGSSSIDFITDNNDFMATWVRKYYDGVNFNSEFYQQRITPAYQIDLGPSNTHLNILNSQDTNIEQGTNNGISRLYLAGDFTDVLSIETETNLMLADINTTVSADRDWSSITADSSLADSKAFVHNLASVAGASPTFTLYVPISASLVTQAVIICPDAASMTDVTLDCTNKITKVEADTDVERVNVAGQDYWKISGLSGTGGIAEPFVEPSPTPTVSITPVSPSTTILPPTATPILPTATGVVPSATGVITIDSNTPTPTDIFSPTGTIDPTVTVTILPTDEYGPFVTSGLLPTPTKIVVLNTELPKTGDELNEDTFIDDIGRILAVSVERLGSASSIAPAVALVGTNIVTYPGAFNYFFLWLRRNKKQKKTALIYDAETHQGLAFVTVNLISNDNQILQTVTDLEGKYSLLATAGEHQLVIKKSGYQTFEGKVTLNIDGIFALDIALSESLNQQNFLHAIKRFLENHFDQISLVLMITGFLFTLLQLIFNYHFFTLLLLFLYIFVLLINLIRWIQNNSRNWGVITDSVTGENVAGIFIKVFSKTEQRQLDVNVSDELGRFQFRLEPGIYRFLVDGFDYQLDTTKLSPQNIFTSPTGQKFYEYELTDTEKFVPYIPVSKSFITNKLSL